MTSWPNYLPSGKHRFGIEVQHDERDHCPLRRIADSCLPRLTARRNRPNALRDWQQRGEIKTFPERFTPSIKFSTILDRISAHMCVIFRIAKKSLSVQRE